MANIDNSKPNPSDKSNFVQNVEFDWPSFQPGVIYADRGYEAEMGSAPSGSRVFLPSPYNPVFKGLVETLFKRYRATITTDGSVEGSEDAS